MLHGYNNDVEYRGKEFHIQTEDLGEGIGKIEAQIFHEGQILDTETISYDEVMEGTGDDGNLKKKLKSLLQATHKGLYERLVSGEYDEIVGLDPVEDEEIEDVTDPDEFQPSQERVPDAAKQVEEEGEEAFKQFHESKAEKHVNLDDLKGHLEDVDSDAEETDEGDASDEEEDSSGEVDEALSGVGSELGEIADVPAPSEAVSEEETEQTEESRATIPPGSMEASDVAEVSLDEDLEESSKVTRTNPDEDASPDRSDAVRRVGEMIPVTGVSAYRGCEEPDDLRSILPLVESFLEGED